MLYSNDITVKLGSKEILKSVAFSAHNGALTAIVGPNGSGKTTLLRALVGEVTFEGNVHLEGRDIRACPAWELASIRAVLPQSTPLSFPFTVAEVVRLGMRRGYRKTEGDLVGPALARVGLSGFEGRYYQELSGGEQQRVQLARVLTQVWDPVVDGQARWLFLDEPVSALDIGHQLQVMSLARQFADAGGGVVAVMHDLNLTAMFADKVALIREGQIHAQGRVEDVLTNDNLSAAYDCPIRVNEAPATGRFLLPHVVQTQTGENAWT